MNQHHPIIPGAARRSLRHSGGFTAIEISAVATIIAIMALILIPIVRNRVEESRVVAAQDDMKGIETAESLAFGYTNYYYSLNNLSRPESSTVPGAVAAVEASKPPHGSWNAPFQSGQQSGIYSTWKGSFVAYHHTRDLFDLESIYPQLFRRENGGGLGGPLLILQYDIDQRANPNALGRLYPIDPWGNPYIYFGPGAIGTVGPPAIPPANQGTYDTSVVYSMGPDSNPSSTNIGGYNPTTQYNNPSTYFRETGLLGITGSDDLKREF